MRRAPAGFFSLLCSLPVLGSALVILSVPPVSRLLPAAFEAPVQRAAALPFLLIERLPPGSPAGQLFYGSYDILVPVFGPSALAAHSALLALPWLALSLWLATRALRRESVAEAKRTLPAGISPQRVDPAPDLHGGTALGEKPQASRSNGPRS